MGATVGRAPPSTFPWEVKDFVNTLKSRVEREGRSPTAAAAALLYTVLLPGV